MRRNRFQTVPPRYRSILLAVCAGLFFSLLLLAAFGAALRVIDAAPSLLTAMAGVSLSCGCFSAGFFAAKQRRKRGLRLGLLCGLFTYFSVFLAGSILLKSFAGLPPLSRLLLALLFGAVGGVCGVNTRIKRPPRC